MISPTVFALCPITCPLSNHQIYIIIYFQMYQLLGTIAAIFLAVLFLILLAGWLKKLTRLQQAYAAIVATFILCVVLCVVGFVHTGEHAFLCRSSCVKSLTLIIHIYFVI
uniref:Leukocyte surface antigen CD53-like n=1 Tax=Steinernema glaseri TaxID=37863 RepID=A0A1I7ZTL8_9BILA